jgi:tellurium resistance protein TerD
MAAPILSAAQIKLPCPFCGDSIKYEESLGGKTIPCGYCKKPLKMPLVTQLPPEYQDELRQKQDKVRKKAEAAEQKRLRAEQKECERRHAEVLQREELEKRAKEARLLRVEEAARQQQYAKATADARAEPDKPKIWHCSINGKTHGPMKESILQQWATDGAIGADDYVRVEGSVTWIRLSDIPERFHIPVRSSQAQPNTNAPVQDGDDNSVRCPKCGCSQLSTEKKGMSGSDACCGALLLGPLGLLCGLHGANKVIVTCLKCGHQWSRG